MATIHNAWYNEWQQMTAGENKWQQVVQPATANGTASDDEWYNEWQQLTCDNEMTASNNEWQRAVILANLLFFLMREKRTTMHPKENSLISTQGWFIWSTPVNFCQYLLIELFNPPDFFWLSLTLKYSHWTLYNFISGTDTKSQIIGNSTI